MFNENLKIIRKAKGYTQEELAIKIHVVRQTISKWEKGLSVPDADMLSKLADVLEINVSELLGSEIKEETNKEIWLWSGYTYDEIISNPRRKEILEQVDVLIDGPFKAEMKNLSLKYRGSENQRVIDVKKSLQENKVVLINAI